MMTTYQKILNASTKLMEKNGYHGTSIQMIADQVGVTKATVLHHFASKEGILLSILQEPVPLVYQGLRDIAEDASMSGLEKLTEFLHFHMAQVAERRDVLDLLLRESKYLSRKNKEVFRRGQREYATLVVGIIAQVQKEEGTLFAGLDPRIVANAVLGMCNWTITWRDNTRGADIDEITRNYSEIIFRNRNGGEMKNKSSAMAKSSRQAKEEKRR